MKLLGLAALVVVAIGACASHTGSAANVPKKTIERAANTKIDDDAGVAARDAG